VVVGGFWRVKGQKRQIKRISWRRRPESNRGPRICNPLRFYMIQSHTGIATPIATPTENLSLQDSLLHASKDVVAHSVLGGVRHESLLATKAA